jgi:hypothetical protein
MVLREDEKGSTKKLHELEDRNNVDTKKLGVRVKFLSNSQESMTKTLIGKEVSGEVDPQTCLCSVD